VTAWCRWLSLQVCLPPLAPISAFVVPEHQRVLEPVYVEQLLHELRLILQEIPHDQLAIQWDTNFEFGMLEGIFPVWFDDVKGGILEKEGSIHVSDVQLVCPECGEKTRIGRRELGDGRKVRVCRKCNGVIDK
jgi:hypothetical protein